jgi:hypothetical protein
MNISKKIYMAIVIGIISLLIININGYCIERYKAFMTNDYENLSSDLKNAVYNAKDKGARTFMKLGYKNVFSNTIPIVENTSDKNVVLNWIREKSNNYGFYIYAHGDEWEFAIRNGVPSTYIHPREISGNWHLVFLDSCSCLATDRFARAFNVIGHNRRAIIGWYKDIDHRGSSQWWNYFYAYAGNMGLRDACLKAAGKVDNWSTPIKMYGDKSWNGRV